MSNFGIISKRYEGRIHKEIILKKELREKLESHCRRSLLEKFVCLQIIKFYLDFYETQTYIFLEG